MHGAAFFVSDPLSAVGVELIEVDGVRKFADLLLDEVANSLESKAVADLEEEVIELGLLDYCREALTLAALGHHGAGGVDRATELYAQAQELFAQHVPQLVGGDPRCQCAGRRLAALGLSFTLAYLAC